MKLSEYFIALAIITAGCGSVQGSYQSCKFVEGCFQQVPNLILRTFQYFIPGAADYANPTLCSIGTYVKGCLANAQSDSSCLLSVHQTLTWNTFTSMCSGVGDTGDYIQGLTDESCGSPGENRNMLIQIFDIYYTNYKGNENCRQAEYTRDLFTGAATGACGFRFGSYYSNLLGSLDCGQLMEALEELKTGFDLA